MKNYKIIDAFIISDEVEFLEMRLDYLNDCVDLFILIGDTTFNIDSRIKKLMTDSKWSSKIQCAGNLINFSSESIKNQILDFSDQNTLIFIGNINEFPDVTKFDKIWNVVKDKNIPMCLKQKVYYRSVSNILAEDFDGTLALTKNILFNHDLIKIINTRKSLPKIIESGFYFSSFLNEKEDTEIVDFKIIGTDTILPNIPTDLLRYDFVFKNTFKRVELKPQQKKRKKEAMQIILEIENLQLTVAKSEPTVILEIGTANGGTLSRWFEIPSVRTIISLDLPEGIHGGSGYKERTYVISDAIEQANMSGKEFYPVNGNSKDLYVINRISELLNGRTIDFLFIDGDHNYEGVKQDFEIYKQFLSKESLVAFHDIIDSEYHREQDCMVSEFWKELKNEYEYKEFVFTNSFDKLINLNFTDASRKGGFGGIGIIYYNRKAIKEKMSLIVPIYNNVDKAITNIRTTLESSKYIDEVILYSNGTDKFENEKLQDAFLLDNRFKLHIVEKPIGFIKAINNSLKLAKNDLIICLNSDAYLYSDWEKRIINLHQEEDYGLIGPIMYDNFVLGCCIIFKKKVINMIGMLDEGFGLGYEEDIEYSERVMSNNLKLGYCEHKSDLGLTKEVSFPIFHSQGETFTNFYKKEINDLIEKNKLKRLKFKNSKNIVVLKNMTYEEVVSRVNDEELFIIINNSGPDFEKIRYDEKLISIAKIIECTDEMDIESVIDALTINKKYEICESKNSHRPSFTWLTKFDDFSSMGIVSQKILQNLRVPFACKSIIGETNTKSRIIREALDKETNYDIGIVFSYPDIHRELERFKTKVVYTGTDTNGGIPNFKSNIDKFDFILTPSEISKKYMINLGVKKPIFVLPHGVDEDKFIFRKRKKDDIFRFLYIGECSDRKGIFQLLEAFISLFNNNKKVELHIKSNEEMFFYNGAEIKKILELHNNIHWHIGNNGQDTIIKLYEDSHAYIYPSRADTFGLTLIEAMACGLPVISTDLPGATEIIEKRYYRIVSRMVSVKGHPWMMGEWGEPDIQSIKNNMMCVYNNYDEISNSTTLIENSEYIRNNFSWKNIAKKFELEILPKLRKSYKVLTLITSYNRNHHISNIINSLKQIREPNLLNKVYIVENSDSSDKAVIIDTINKNIDADFVLHISDFNLGQRGSLLQMLEDMNLDDYDYIQFSDQDNIFLEPISTYCKILDEFPDIFFATGYMSKEHEELGWRDTNYGRLCEKRSLRAGHMLMRTTDLKKMLPLHLDSQFGQPHNSSWNAGLDWELTYWNKNSPGRLSQNNFVLCVPGGVQHKGIDSTLYEWDVDKYEYSLSDLENMRKAK